MKSSRLSCASRSMPVSAAYSSFIVAILYECQRFTHSRLFEIWGKFRPVHKHGVRVFVEIPAMTCAETYATGKVVFVLELVVDLKLSFIPSDLHKFGS